MAGLPAGELNEPLIMFGKFSPDSGVDFTRIL